MTQWELHELTDRELVQKGRSYPSDDIYGIEIREEIACRRAKRHDYYLTVSTVAAAISAIGSMIAAFISLVR
jgi:hypothetical protein